MTMLQDVTTKVTDGSHNPPKKQETGVPMYSAQNVLNNHLDTKSFRLISEESFASENKRTNVEEGDVLLTIVGTIGRSYVVKPDDGKFALQRSVALIKPDRDKINSRYLCYYFQSNIAGQYLSSNSRGVAQKGIYLGILNKMPVPLVSLLDQAKIVAKIEELFSEIDSSSTSLQNVPTLIDLFYQARLQKIFLGTDQTISTIDTHALHQSMSQYRSKSPNAKRLNLDTINDRDLPDLGERGFWASIDLLATNEKHSIKAGPFGSSIKKSMYSSSGYKVYGQEQVIRQDSDYGNYYISKDKYEELSSNAVAGGDALISLVGTVGRVLVLPEHTEDGIINPRLVKISFNKEHYLPDLFKYYFESQFVKTIYKLKTHGATMDVLNLGIIRTIPVPVFSIHKQQEMLDSISALQSEVEVLKKQLGNISDLGRSLKLAALTTAFRGEET